MNDLRNDKLVKFNVECIMLSVLWQRILNSSFSSCLMPENWATVYVIRSLPKVFSRSGKKLPWTRRRVSLLSASTRFYLTPIKNEEQHSFLAIQKATLLHDNDFEIKITIIKKAVIFVYCSLMTVIMLACTQFVLRLFCFTSCLRSICI